MVSAGTFSRDRSPYKEGDCVLTKVVIDHACIVGRAINDRHTKWEVCTQYSFRERYPIYAEDDQVFSTVKAAQKHAKKNKLLIVKLMEFSSVPNEYSLDGKKYTLELKKVLVER